MYNNVLPEAKLATSNTDINGFKSIITHGAPVSIVKYLQPTVTLCITADKSQVTYNISSSSSSSSSSSYIYDAPITKRT